MNPRLRHFYEFDGFRVDIEERELLLDGVPVVLTPKVFDTLLALVENNGHALAKDELMELVWSDAFVEPGNLNRNISVLRKALGDSSHEPRYIRTIPTRGYRFEAEVRKVAEEAEVVTLEKRTNYSLSVSAEREGRYQ